ncbi:hypothetical protein FIC_01575 [Flavobacteriaceae bacterium 3519-10]|nr:hypothetical protein FIC_01575 [Flavobacteriaceae bacterium 3519-10]
MIKVFLILLLSLISCNTEYKTFYNLHELKPKTFETESSKGNTNLIHIYSFDNNILDRRIKGFKSLTYSTLTSERVYIATETKNRKKYIASPSKRKHFEEFDFILDQYLKGNTEYLKTLVNSFSGAEIGSNFYLFDFRTNKVLEIAAIGFDSDGKLIQ